MEINLNELTLQDVIDVEEVTGHPFGTMAETGFSALGLAALVWVVTRKAQPEFTLDDAKATKLLAVKVLDDEPDPTSANV